MSGYRDSGSFNAKRLWSAEELQKKADSALAAETAKAVAQPACYDDNSGAIDEEAKSDWEQLRLTAKLVFPEVLAVKFQLHAKQRLVGIAHVLGWSISKISKAANIPRGTIYMWAKKEAFKEFIKAFEYHRGSRDSRELVEKEQYSAVEVLRNLMNDPNVSPGTRKDIAQWFFEQKHGKPKETREIQGTDVRKLTEELMVARGVAPVKDIFDGLAPETPVNVPAPGKPGKDDLN